MHEFYYYYYLVEDKDQYIHQIAEILITKQQFIPEQFTVKAHLALFEGSGRGGEPKNEALLFQSTVS